MWVSDTTIMAHCDADWVEPSTPSGTIALGLAGQMLFSLFADIRGLFGLPQRMPKARDYLALALIIAGSLVLIFLGGAA